MEKNELAPDKNIFVDRMNDLLSRGEFSEALKSAENRRLELPYDTDAYLFIHKALVKMERVDEARDVLCQLEKSISFLSLVFLQAAETYSEQDLNDDASSCYQKFLSLNPHYKHSAEIAGRIDWLKRSTQNVLGADDSENKELPNPELFTVTLADIYIKQGHKKMAFDILAEIISRDPTNIQARKKLDELSAAMKKKSANANIIATLSSWLKNIDRLKYAK